MRDANGARLVPVHRVRSVLREHYLAGIVCDHESATDAAACNCARWRSPVVESPAAAAKAWIDHFVDELLKTDSEGSAARGPESVL